MPHSDQNNNGFSLVELMIVIVIIGVLAAISGPIYSKLVENAKRTESDAALGSIHRQLEIYYGEHGKYPKEQHDEYVIHAFWNDFKEGELTGKYFSDSSYTYFGSANGRIYKITCAKGTVLEYDRTLDQDGVLKDE